MIDFSARRAVKLFKGHALAPKASLLGGMRLFNILLGFVTTLTIANALGAHSFGLFAFAVGVAAIGSAMMRFGLPLLIVRHTAEAYEREDWNTYSQVMRYSAVMGVLIAISIAGGMLSLYFFTGVLPNEYGLPFIIGVVGACLITFNTHLQARLRAVSRVVFAYSTEFIVFQITMLLSALTLVAANTLNIQTALIAFLICWAISVSITLYMWRVYQPRVKRPSTLTVSWRELTYANLSLFLLGLIPLAVGKVEVLFLAATVDPSAIGNFAIAFRIASVVSVAGHSISGNFSPLIATLRAAGQDETLQKVIKSAAVLNAASSSIVTMGVGIASWFLLPVAFPEYSDARYLTLILAASFFLASLSGRPFDIVAMLASSKRAALAAMATVPPYLLLLALFTHSMGVYGAAYATSIVFAAYPVILNVVAKNELGFRSDLFFVPKPTQRQQ